MRSSNGVPRATEAPRAEQEPAPDAGLLAALGYTDGTLDENAHLRGTLLAEPEAQEGLNFYSSLFQHGAQLVDNSGRVVHEWSHAWGPWHHAELLPHGDVLVVVQDSRLFKLDRDSNLLWSLEGRFHHDLHVDANGVITALRRVSLPLDAIHPEVETLVDLICEISPDGVELGSHSVLRVLADSPYAFLLPFVAHRSAEERSEAFDVTHANHVEVFDGSLADRSPLFAAGNLLLSVRNLSAIMILAAETLDVLWLWGPSNLHLQHQPVLLENGRILLFNNGRERSAVIEVDPLTNRIAWEYAADGFHSATRGSNQRLANGNTLITESNAGYVYEVTPDGRVVWTFANPVVSPGGVRQAIWRMVRFDPDELDFYAE